MFQSYENLFKFKSLALLHDTCLSSSLVKLVHSAKSRKFLITHKWPILDWLEPTNQSYHTHHWPTNQNVFPFAKDQSLRVPSLFPHDLFYPMSVRTDTCEESMVFIGTTFFIPAHQTVNRPSISPGTLFILLTDKRTSTVPTTVLLKTLPIHRAEH